MNDTKPCPQCGKPVSPASLMGLCPDCMLKAGLASPTETAQAGAHGTEIAPPPPPGEMAQLFPQLEILECLGSGGMGAVYKARQPKLDRFVALKILAREKADDPSFAQRFTREAQTLARLNHPNIVTVYDFGEAGGHFYLVMEYVDGMSLRQLLKAGKMKPEEAVAVVPHICGALQFAHDHGIVHRDIKPENILLDKDGRVKIADFGIAKLLGRSGEGANLTGEQGVIGTPYYMAPEQVERPRLVDHRADIYSLGVVFYEMLTGELPLGEFAAPSKKVWVDVRLDQVVLHALEKEPERRYQHASEVKTDVETIASTPRSPASPPPLNSPGQTPASTSPNAQQRPAAASAEGKLAAARGKVTAPAVGLMIVGVLKLLSALKLLLLFGGPGTGWLEALWANLGVDSALHVAGIGSLSQWLGRVGFGLALSKILLAPLVLFGAAQMLRLRSYAWAIAAAILAIVSMSLVGIPVGIWALIVLTSPGVREAFANPPRR